MQTVKATLQDTDKDTDTDTDPDPETQTQTQTQRQTQTQTQTQRHRPRHNALITWQQEGKTSVANSTTFAHALVTHSGI